MIYQSISGPQKEHKQVQGVMTAVWTVINSFVIVFNILMQFYLNETMFLLASQGEYQFLVLHFIHILFTVYNFIFTAFVWAPNNYFEGLMSLLSFFISAYSVAAMLVMTYWLIFLEHDTTGQAFAVIFITMYLVFPGVQSFTYRMLRRQRNSVEPRLVPVYVDAETFQRVQSQKTQLMV